MTGGPNDVVSVYVTFGDAGEAERIGRAMVEERLAACVNILENCHSVYRWQGSIESTQEVAAIFKTSAARAPELSERIISLHGYALPAVATWPILDCSAPFRSWILAEVS